MGSLFFDVGLLHRNIQVLAVSCASNLDLHLYGVGQNCPSLIQKDVNDLFLLHCFIRYLGEVDLFFSSGRSFRPCESTKAIYTFTFKRTESSIASKARSALVLFYYPQRCPTIGQGYPEAGKQCCEVSLKL